MTDLRLVRAPELVDEASEPRRADLWVAWFLGVVAIGYFVFHKSFAYLGLPQLGLYIGEISFGVALVYSSTRRALFTVVDWLARPGPYHVLAWALLTQLAYGLFQVARGYRAGVDVIELSKYAVFNVYPFALVLGWWAARTVPDFARKFALALAWANAVLGSAFLLVIDRLALTVPGAPDIRLNLGNGAAFALVALVCFEPRLGARWYLLAANGFVLIGAQGRAEWMAAALGLFVWAWATGRLTTIVKGLAAALLALSTVGLLGVQLPTASTRGGSTSLAGVVGRFIATFDPETAQGLVGDRTTLEVAVSTKWRSTWWSAIWRGVNGSADHLFYGYGYGNPLNQLVRFVPEDVRTPHNVLLYALGYGGWLGLIVFLLFQGALVTLLWRVWRRTGQPLGMACWAAAMMIAVFSNWFEAPFGAFPTFMLLGVALGPLTSIDEPSTSRFALEGTRWQHDPLS